MTYFEKETDNKSLLEDFLPNPNCINIMCYCLMCVA